MLFALDYLNLYQRLTFHFCFVFCDLLKIGVKHDKIKLICQLPSFL